MPICVSCNPRRNLPPGLGSLPVARRYQGKSRLISFPSGTEMFHFPELASNTLCIHVPMTGHCSRRVPHSEIHGSWDAWLLPAAYRSLPRLSSPSDAKASTRCSCQLVLENFLPSLFNCKMISRVISRFTVIYSYSLTMPACGLLPHPGGPGKT